MALNPNLRRIVATAAWSGLAVLALGVAGCATANKALGVSKSVPDEFRVVARAPLVVPPDYALRPPAPGEPRPQELQPESQASTSMLGAGNPADRSAGENMLLAKSGGDKADPLIRYVVDDQFGEVAHKDKNFADKVMFWKKGELRTAPKDGSDQAAPVDAATEEAHVEKLVGNGQVIISRGKSNGVKLPGL